MSKENFLILRICFTSSLADVQMYRTSKSNNPIYTLVKINNKCFRDIKHVLNYLIMCLSFLIESVICLIR